MYRTHGPWAYGLRTASPSACNGLGWARVAASCLRGSTGLLCVPARCGPSVTCVRHALPDSMACGSVLTVARCRSQTDQRYLSLLPQVTLENARDCSVSLCVLLCAVSVVYRDTLCSLCVLHWLYTGSLRATVSCSRASVSFLTSPLTLGRGLYPTGGTLNVPCWYWVCGYYSAHRTIGVTVLQIVLDTGRCFWHSSSHRSNTAMQQTAS